MTKIYVIGSSNTDMVVKAKSLPQPGQTVLGGEFFMNPGGKGANQAVAAARLGGAVVLVANVGNDVFGEQALQHFQEENIDCTYVTKDPKNPSGVALISVDEQAENHIVVAPGANEHLTKSHTDAVFDRIPADAIVLIQLEIPMETVAHVIAKAREKGIRAIVNPAPAASLPEASLKSLFLLTPNESEAALLTGIPVTGEQSAKEAAKKLLEMGVENVIVTMGSKGALWVDNHGANYLSVPPVKAVDTTAAGDCFNGALAVGLARKMTIKEAADFACQAAAISVTRFGAQASMPYLRELGSQ